MKILLIVEHDNKKIKQATYHTLSAAQIGQGEIDALVIGAACENVASEASHLIGVTRVLIANHACYAHFLPENSATLIAEIGTQYDVILTNATTFGKNVLPRVAALLNVSLLSEVIQIVSQDTFVRPLYAGNILATVQSFESIKLLTIRATAFPMAVASGDYQAPIVIVDRVIESTQSRFEKQALTISSRPELSEARVVVSGGRGLKSAEHFKWIEKLADQLGGAVGASRAAVDAGLAPNDYQVGQTGKVVAPDLYVAIGISGAIQHVAGMKDSKVIVAINQDPEAPIFQIADYGLVGDLFTVLPALIKELDML